MVSLDDVSVFIAVVEKQSFSAAARDLRISPSAVSKRITRLEYQLRATLINRSSRRVTLSQAGEAFFERCAGIRPIVDEATRAVQGLHSAPGGKLRIHVTAGIGIKLITPLVPRFMAQYPAVSIELTTHVDDSAVVEQGDILINSMPDLLPDKSLDHRDLGTCYYAICATPEYLSRVGTPRKPHDLIDHNCLLYCNDKSQLVNEWPFEDKDGHYTVSVRGGFASNNSAALYEALIRGAGIALMPVYAVFEAVDEGRLLSLFPDESRFQRRVRAYFPRTSHLPINVRLFVDFVASQLDTLTLHKSGAAPRLLPRPQHSRAHGGAAGA